MIHPGGQIEVSQGGQIRLTNRLAYADAFLALTRWMSTVHLPAEMRCDVISQVSESGNSRLQPFVAMHIPRQPARAFGDVALP